jgi:hypothetical protein
MANNICIKKKYTAPQTLRSGYEIRGIENTSNHNKELAPKIKTIIDKNKKLKRRTRNKPPTSPRKRNPTSTPH